MKIAIHKNKHIFDHSTLWTDAWINFCVKNRIDYEVIDCFSPNIIKNLSNFDILLWHFSNYSYTEMNFARSILKSAENLGLKVFPNSKTNWHFDDKVAQSYFLDAIGSSIPKYNVFYTKEKLKEYIKEKPNYPVIAKLKNGAGSNNVKLIRNKKELIKYGNEMFSTGINSTPKAGFKIISNIQSTKSLKTFINRFKRIPDFVKSSKKAREFFNEKNYVYLQEFIDNEGYDLKVVVVGDKLTFLKRNIRNGDFRASGGGFIQYDHTVINLEIIKEAFHTSEKCSFQCMGYDFVINAETKECKIIEISYGFDYIAQLKLGGYYTKDGIFHDSPLNIPEEIIKNLIK